MSESPTPPHDDADLTKTTGHGDAGDKPSEGWNKVLNPNLKGWESSSNREFRYSEIRLAPLIPLFQDYRTAQETAFDRLILQLSSAINNLADSEAKMEAIKLLEKKLKEAKARGENEGLSNIAIGDWATALMQAIDPDKLQTPLKMIGLDQNKAADLDRESTNAQQPQPSTEELREGVQKALGTRGEESFLQSDHQPNESAAEAVAQDH